MIGVELGGALKNVIAICAGIAEGLGYGDNTKAALMTRGVEIEGLAWHWVPGINFRQTHRDRGSDSYLYQYAQQEQRQEFLSGKAAPLIRLLMK